MVKASDSKQWLLKLERYCAWQERCEAEVKAKMEQLDIPIAERAALMEYLQEEGYINEARFAVHFASGKFRLKKWGRIKIRYELAARSIAEKYINEALSNIDVEEYGQVLRQILIEKRRTLTKIKDPYELNHKVSVYAINKGFEPDLVWEILKGK